MFVIVLVAGIPDKFMVTYMKVMDWFFTMLSVYKHKLKCKIEFHCDYEIGMRNGIELSGRLHGYDPIARQERFHLLQMLIKAIGANHLRGAYMFSNKGDISYFNEFKYNLQLFFVSNMLPLVGHGKMWQYLRNQITKALMEMPAMKTKKEVLKHGIDTFWKWFDNVLSGTDSSRYTLKQTNGFRQSIRTSNKMESMHNKLKKALGVHNNIYGTSNGMQVIENKTLCDYIMHTEQEDELELSKEQQAIEDQTRAVWDDIDQEIRRLSNQVERVTNKFWCDQCVRLQNIHYGGRSWLTTLTEDVFADFEAGILQENPLVGVSD